MSYITEPGIVLSRADWRDNDRLLTLISPDRGRVEAVARGVKKPASALSAAGELFVMADFTIYQGKGRPTITQAAVTDSFYPLREDYNRLSHANLIRQTALNLISPDEPQPHLYILLARSLARLCYQPTPMPAVTAAYLLHAASIAGFRPVLAACSECGALLTQDSWLSAAAGGLVCPDCRGEATAGRRVSPAQLDWLRVTLDKGVDHAPEVPAPLLALWHYMQDVLDRPLPKPLLG